MIPTTEAATSAYQNDHCLEPLLLSSDEQHIDTAAFRFPAVNLPSDS